MENRWTDAFLAWFEECSTCLLAFFPLTPLTQALGLHSSGLGVVLSGPRPAWADGVQEAGGGPWTHQESQAEAGWARRRQWSPGTHCQDLGAEREGRAVHREALAHPPAWGRSF